jgi:hypothetical protein
VQQHLLKSSKYAHDCEINYEYDLAQPFGRPCDPRRNANAPKEPVTWNTIAQSYFGSDRIL